MAEDKCICCGAVIPEGLQVCPSCEAKSQSAARSGRLGGRDGSKLIVYVCSPYSGNVERNIRYAQELTKWALRKGYAPITPHLYLPQVLDDTEPAERALGLTVGRELLKSCSLILVGEQFGISAGMATEIREALRLCIPIQYV